jgi:hypothetical protein
VAGVHCCHLRHDIYKNSFHIQKSCNHDTSTCILPELTPSVYHLFAPLRKSPREYLYTSDEAL